MRRYLPFLVPFVLIVSAGVGARLWLGLEPPRGEPVELSLDDVDVDTPFVRVTAEAHYASVVRQNQPGNLLIEGGTFYLFPLFEVGDSKGRAIRILVRTPREPERLVSYERMTLEGRLTRPTQDKVPYDTEIVLGSELKYFFEDNVLLLEPWRIESGDEVWEAP